jgi:bacteriocin biosynthesis cyclodehydratase domain-containing protein
MVEAAMNSMEAYLTTIVPGQTGCLNCLFPEKPDWDRRGFAVLGAVSGTLACLTALEAIKLITGFERPLMSQLLTMDLGRLEFAKHRTYRDPDCPVCGKNAPWRSFSRRSTTAAGGKQQGNFRALQPELALAGDRPVLSHH